jgi:hypothetical protein
MPADDTQIEKRRCATPANSAPCASPPSHRAVPDPGWSAAADRPDPGEPDDERPGEPRVLAPQQHPAPSPAAVVPGPEHLGMYTSRAGQQERQRDEKK